MNITIVVSAVAGLSWLLVVGLLVFTVLRASQQKTVKGLVTGLLIALLFALILNTVSAGLVFLQPEERGVVISALESKGYREEALQPGLRWVIPYAETVQIYNISKQTYTMSIASSEGQILGDDSVSARTSDGQEIFIDASVIFSIDPAKVVDLHITWQQRFTNDLVRPRSRGVIRDAVSQFRVDQVYSTKREEMAEQMENDMAEALAENGLILADFVLRNITFSPEYAASVEQKQIAEQLAQQAAFTVQQKEQEAEQVRKTAQGQADAAVIEAEGRALAIVIQAKADAEARVLQATAEAEALELISIIINANPDMLKYRYIEELTPYIDVMLLPSDNPFLFPLPELENTQQPGITIIPQESTESP